MTKVLALDYGSARTGVAVSDPTGIVVRPLGVVRSVREPDGFDRLMEVPGIGSQDLLDLSDRFKQRSAPAAIVLGSSENGTVNLVVNFDQAVADRLSAGDVVKQIAPIVGGGGGGRPNMAQAGGKDPAKLGDALAQARKLIEAQLTK